MTSATGARKQMLVTVTPLVRVSVTLTYLGLIKITVNLAVAALENARLNRTQTLFLKTVENDKHENVVVSH